MSLLKRIAKHDFLGLALRGVSKKLRDEFDIAPVITTTEKVKELLQAQTITKNMDVDNRFSYPYSYMQLGAVAGTNDELNSNAVARVGAANSSQVGDGERATTSTLYVWPILSDLEYHYCTTDPAEARNVACVLAILSQLGGLRFTLKMNFAEIGCRLEIPLNTAIPIASMEDPANPGATDIVASMVLHTKIGFIQNVAAVNGNRPIYITDVDGQEISGELDD